MKFTTIFKRFRKKLKTTFVNIVHFKIKLIYAAPICIIIAAIIATIIFLRADFLSVRKIEAATQNAKSEIAILNSELTDFKNELKTVMEIRDRYRVSVKEIVDMLYNKDMAMGGTLNTIPDTDEIKLLHLRNVVQSMDDDIGLLEEVKSYLLARKGFADNFPFIWPIELLGQPDINSPFGIRSNTVTGKRPSDGYHFHAGIDLNGKHGDPIIATAGGKVTYVTRNHSIYGYFVIIQHKYEFSTYYAHLSSLNVTRGQEIKRGDLIGGMGNTGKSLGVHLHYEIRASGTPIDPLTFLAVDY